MMTVQRILSTVMDPATSLKCLRLFNNDRYDLALDTTHGHTKILAMQGTTLAVPTMTLRDFAYLHAIPCNRIRTLSKNNWCFWT